MIRRGPNHALCHCRRVSSAGLVLACCWLSTVALGESPSASTAAPSTAAEQGGAGPFTLHTRIDRLVRQEAVGPFSHRCSDQDFVRRVYLDLTGVIPTAAQAQSFLDDKDGEKRETLVKTLVDSPQFARRMALHLNALFLERRKDAHVDVTRWESYLIRSLVQRKPLDQLLAELLHPESAEGQAQAASKFLLNREAEPHAMTREVGRLMFGMDLQCAQCHDHPLISDYSQADYYGLYAFLQRTKPFRDPKTKKSVLAEAATGEAKFTSVFTGEGKLDVSPKTPFGRQLHDEPEATEAEGYLVKPDKKHGGRPRFSRRQALAESLASNRRFQRNLANRLWSFLFGQGLVHPADYHTRDNPPVHPRLLAELADGLVKMDFDTHAFIRELARSQAYQRAVDPPSPESVNFVEAELRHQDYSSKLEAVSEECVELEKHFQQAQEAWQTAQEKQLQLEKEQHQQSAALQELAKALSPLQQQYESFDKQFNSLQARLAAIDAVDQATRQARAKFQDEPLLAETQASLEQRIAQLKTEVESVGDKLASAKSMVDAKRKEKLAVERSLAELKQQFQPVAQCKRLEQEFLIAKWKLSDARDHEAWCGQQIRFCEQLLAYQESRETDPPAAAATWDQVTQAWEDRIQVARLKPLSPEQLAASMMRATGVLSQIESAAEAAIEKSPPPALKDEATPDNAKAAIRHAALQQQWVVKTRGTLNQFVLWYGGIPGEEFQATANQALFLGNSPTVSGWLKPASGNLIQTAQAIESERGVLEHVTFHVLSRPPSLAEQQDWIQLLEQIRGEHDDPLEAKNTAIREWIWALMSSNEFRFNH